MWLASRTGVFTYFCIFQLKKLETDKTEKRIRKAKEGIVMEEIVNKDVKKTSKNC